MTHPPQPTKLEKQASLPPSESGPSAITVEIIRASAKVLQAIAWPIAAVILALMLIHFIPLILADLSDVARGKQSVEMGIGEKGPYVRIVEQTAQVMAGVITQQNSAGDIVNGIGQIQKPDVGQLAKIAADAVVESHARAALGSSPITKILWVDDHPENNVGLTSAFEALGMKVVGVKGNDEIPNAFQREGRFDIVITDMTRDSPLDHQAGLKTVELIKRHHPGVPVIIYSAQYAAEHKGDTLPPPVIAITNSPEAVFRLATGQGIGPTATGS
jgi:CheY-like chemotaxis protein